METVIKVICAIFLPPIAVCLHRREPLGEALINCVLWLCCCHVGGIVHAIYTVFALEDTRGWKLQ